MNDVQERTAMIESLTQPELDYIKTLESLGGTGMEFEIPIEKYDSSLCFLLTIRGFLEINLDGKKIMCKFA